MKLSKRIFSVLLIFLFSFCIFFDLYSVNAFASMYGTINGNEVSKKEFYEEMFKYRPEEHLNHAQPDFWPSFDEVSDSVLFGGKPMEQLTLMERASAMANYQTALKDAEKISFASPIWQQIGKVTNELSVGNGSGQLVPSSKTYYQKIDPETGLYEYELPSSGAGSAALGLAGLGAYLGGKYLGVMRKDDFNSELWRQMESDLGKEALQHLSDDDYKQAIAKYMQSVGYNVLALMDEGADAGDPVFICAETLFSDQLQALQREKSDLSSYYADHPAPLYQWDGSDTVGKVFTFDLKYTSYDSYNRESYNTDYHLYRDSSLRGATNYRLCWRIYPEQWDSNTRTYYLEVYNSSGQYEGREMAYIDDNYSVVSGHTVSEKAGKSFTLTDLRGQEPFFYTNIPIFSDSSYEKAYLKTGVGTGAINAPDPSADPKYEYCPLPVAQPEYCPQLLPYTPYTSTDLLDYFDEVNEKHDELVATPDFNPGISPVTLPQPVTAPDPQPYSTIVKAPVVDPDPVTDPDPQPGTDPSTQPSGNFIDIPDWMDRDAEFEDLQGDAGMLKEVFPFCVPHDILLAFQTFGSSGSNDQIHAQNARLYANNRAESGEYKPVFLFPLEFDIFGEKISYDLRLDITEGAENFIEYFKWFQVILFCFGLMKLSFKISHTF